MLDIRLTGTLWLGVTTETNMITVSLRRSRMAKNRSREILHMRFKIYRPPEEEVNTIKWTDYKFLIANANVQINRANRGIVYSLT